MSWTISPAPKVPFPTSPRTGVAVFVLMTVSLSVPGVQEFAFRTRKATCVRKLRAVIHQFVSWKTSGSEAAPTNSRSQYGKLVRLGFRAGDSEMTVSDPSSLHSLVGDMEETGTLVQVGREGTQNILTAGHALGIPGVI